MWLVQLKIPYIGMTWLQIMGAWFAFNRSALLPVGSCQCASTEQGSCHTAKECTVYIIYLLQLKMSLNFKLRWRKSKGMILNSRLIVTFQCMNLDIYRCCTSIGMGLFMSEHQVKYRLTTQNLACEDLFTLGGLGLRNYSWSLSLKIQSHSLTMTISLSQDTISFPQNNYFAPSN